MPYYQQETQCLFLRKMTLEDIDEWEQFFINNPLEQYVGVDTSLPPRTKTTNWITLQLKRYQTNDLGHLAAIHKITGALISVSGLIKRTVEETAELEIAYSIIPKYWGNGYATEIASQMRIYATEHQLAPSFISIISLENITSKNVARKNGMSKVKTTSYQGQVVDVFRLVL